MNRKSVVAISAAVTVTCCSLLLPQTPTSAYVALYHAPMHRLGPPKNASTTPYGWSSTNWSGYALSGTTGQYNSISGNWTVPTVAPSKGSSYSSSWIGIDGFNNSDLIQTGTEQDYYSGASHYDAWWEILPAAETVITNMTVQPGDQMSANIVNDGNGNWTITIDDKTRGETFTTTQAYSGPAESAEWIQEAPTIGGRVATLANYGSTTFDPGTVNGVDPGLVVADGGVMDQKRQQVSTPSLPDSDTDGFTVAYGSTAPAAPAS